MGTVGKPGLAGIRGSIRTAKSLATYGNTRDSRSHLRVQYKTSI